MITRMSLFCMSRRFLLHSDKDGRCTESMMLLTSGSGDYLDQVSGHRCRRRAPFQSMQKALDEFEKVATHDSTVYENVSNLRGSRVGGGMSWRVRARSADSPGAAQLFTSLC